LLISYNARQEYWKDSNFKGRFCVDDVNADSAPPRHIHTQVLTGRIGWRI